MATLTTTYVPNTKTGGSSPTLQNGSIIDTGTSSGFGNVGIGSLNPGQQLDVNGTVRGTFFSGNASNMTNLPITLTTTGTSGASSWTQGTNTLNIPQYTGGGGSGTVNAGTANQAAYYATSASAVSGTSDLIFNGNNVGIGSPTPGTILDIQGTVRSIAFVTTGTIPGSINYLSANVGIGSASPSGSLDVGTGTICLNHTCNSTWPTGGGAGNWLINNVGIGTYQNVGIGTINPSTSLQVVNAGTSEFSVNTSGNVISNGTLTSGSTGQSNYGYGLVVNSGNNTTVSGGDFNVNNSSGKVILDVGATSGNIGIGTSVADAAIAIGGACAAHPNVGMCICTPSGGGAAMGFCSGALGSCSACTCC